MGACPDSVQGGKNDVTLLGARLDGNSRCVEYSRPATASGGTSQRELCII